MEEIIKQKIQESVEKVKTKLKSQGYELSGTDEQLFRMGVSYGISISSIALSSLPVDITFLEPEKKVKDEDNDLPSLEEYENMNNVNIEDIVKQWSKPKFKCPKCGGGMCKNEMVTLTSYPASYEYSCNKCGHIEYLDF